MKDRGGQGTEEKGGGILLRRGGRGGLAPKPKKSNFAHGYTVRRICGKGKF